MAKETNSKSTTLPFKLVLLKLMADRALSATQIAALAGVARSVVGDWTNGSAPRDLAAVGKLAKALGLSMRELLLDEVEDSMEGNDDSHLGTFEEQPLVDGVFRITLHRLVAPTGKRHVKKLE